MALSAAERLIGEAEAYFEKHQIRPLLTSLITELATEQPADPVQGLLFYLSRRLQGLGKQAGAPPKEPSPLPIPASPAAAAAAAPAAEPTDAEGDDEDGARAQLDPLSLLLEESLPGPTKAEPSSPRELGLAGMRSWAGGFRRDLLDGWVKQPSPCCAAASVAGAFNALWGLGAGSEGRCTVRECADLMADHCDALRAQRQARLERLLGAQAGGLDEFLTMLDRQLESAGLDWAARAGPKAVTRKAALAAVRQVLAETVAEPAREAGAGRDVLEALREVLGSAPEAAGTEAAEEAEEEAAEAPEALVASTSSVDWRKELHELFTKRKAVLRLRDRRPNTGQVGSWGIRQAAEDLSRARSTEPLRVTCLLGRRNCMKKVAWTVAAADSEAVVHQQWSALKAAFGQPRAVLLFHLTNHYALIFAWREWQEEGGAQKLRRQVLTARRGQRPSAWLEFSEVRSIILGWSGYHILQVERLPGAAATESGPAPSTPAD